MKDFLDIYWQLRKRHNFEFWRAIKIALNLMQFVRLVK